MRMVRWKNTQRTLLYDWMISGGCGDLARNDKKGMLGFVPQPNLR